MKVLYIDQHFSIPTQIGGTRSYELSQGLIRAGHSVCMICGESINLDLPRLKGENISRGFLDGIDVIQILLPYSNSDNLLRRTKIFLLFAFKCIKFVLKEKYDLLFATSTPLTAGIPGIIMKIFRNKPFVFEVRDLWPELPKALGLRNPLFLLGMRALEFVSYHSADSCVGLSPGICEGIQRRSQKGKKIAMIPNGCDLDLFRPELHENLSLDGICGTDKVAVFSGAHGIANGLDAVLDAAVELKKMKRNDIILAFIGDGKMKPYLVERAKKEGLNNCKFYNPMPKKDLNKVVASADVGLMILANIPAFYYGTSPNKFFDYISSGLPILNNYPGWLADMIKNDNLGVVVPPNNPKAFAEGLILLLDNENLRFECGRNARKYAEANFSRIKLANQFVDFLEKTFSAF